MSQNTLDNEVAVPANHKTRLQPRPNARQFTTVVQTTIDSGESGLGPNVQLVDALIKITDKVTGEPIRFDPNSIMIQPSGSRIQIKGIISRDGTGTGIPPGVPNLTTND